jgi:hypothetical protein
MSRNRLTAVFLVFGFRLRQGYGGQVVSAQLQDFLNLLLRRSLAKNQILAVHRYIFSVNAPVEGGGTRVFGETPKTARGTRALPFSFRPD